MIKMELNAFRRTLENRQAELGKGNRNREALAIQVSPDELDRIQDASEREMAIGNIERNSSRLREVRTALQRIDAGIFGTCIECEADISPKRLARDPVASSRMVCQEAADREQKTSWNDVDTAFDMSA